MSGFWIRIAPTGCVEGSVYASALKADSSEEAHREFTPRVGDRRRETQEGWRHDRVERDEWKRRAKPCLMGECRHPDYQGRPLADVPTGGAL